MNANISDSEKIIQEINEISFSEIDDELQTSELVKIEEYDSSFENFTYRSPYVEEKIILGAKYPSFIAGYSAHVSEGTQYNSLFEANRHLKFHFEENDLKRKLAEISDFYYLNLPNLVILPGEAIRLTVTHPSLCKAIADKTFPNENLLVLGSSYDWHKKEQLLNAQEYKELWGDTYPLLNAESKEGSAGNKESYFKITVIESKYIYRYASLCVARVVDFNQEKSQISFDLISHSRIEIWDIIYDKNIGLHKVYGICCDKNFNMPSSEFQDFEKYKNIQANLDLISKKFAQFLSTINRNKEKNSYLSKEQESTFKKISNSNNIVEKLSFYAQTYPFDNLRRQIINQSENLEYMENILRFMIEKDELQYLSGKIMERVRAEVDKNQKEYYLREQLKSIYKELGDSETVEEERENYLAALQKLRMSDDIRERLTKEINKLLKYPQGVPEAAILRNYLDLVMELPWGKLSKENLDIKTASEILNSRHSHMKKVKERILEYLAVRKLQLSSREEVQPTILCLVGPPGVGKTSIAKSMAEAVGRVYVRLSLGGVKDEAEIRGHRRTYVGAMPGRMINAMKQAGTDNPLILLDEIDKLGSDFKGDPSSALLELLDPGQNNAFSDHYLEIPYDFSKVLFVTTANNLSSIPEPLLDRLEIISMEGYTELEKLTIARDHLWPKLLANACYKSKINLSDDAVLAAVRNYTRESGVRQLERVLAKVLRKLVLQQEMKNKNTKNIKLHDKDIREILGTEIYSEDRKNMLNPIGTVTGLAWTGAGGDVLKIEVAVMPGSGKINLTGNLGDVMKESAQVALTYIRTVAHQLNLADDFYSKNDFHIHVPEGAVPKDGPSAGITLALALTSALCKQRVSADIAMTGELSMSGSVLAIGGLKEKSLAAKRYGISKIYIPIENQRHYDELDDEIKQNLEVVFLSDVWQLIEENIKFDLLLDR